MTQPSVQLQTKLTKGWPIRVRDCLGTDSVVARLILNPLTGVKHNLAIRRYLDILDVRIILEIVL